MILLIRLKINFSLIGKGFYSQVVKCMLDIPSPKITSSSRYIALDATCNHIKDVSLCSLYQTKGFFNG